MLQSGGAGDAGRRDSHQRVNHVDHAGDGAKQELDWHRGLGHAPRLAGQRLLSNEGDDETP
jgi:hypothetical protein